jgi:hypothetical protein
MMNPPNLTELPAPEDTADLIALVRERPSPRAQAANVKRSLPVKILLGINLFLLLAATALVGWFYQVSIKPYLRSTADPGIPIARPVNLTLPEELGSDLQQLENGIARLQEQLDALRSSQDSQKTDLEELKQAWVKTRGLAETSTGLSTTESAGVTQVVSDTPTANVAATSSAARELLLIKERNRLTAYADECIATGERRYLELVTKAIQYPEIPSLSAAAKAEYLRITQHFQLMQRIDPNYKLPLKELFPDGNLRDEADLSTTQIIEVLKNQESDWRTRLRAAYLLGGRRTREVGDALLAAMQTDPNLDVMKEAQLTFQQNTEQYFLLFDLPAIEAWWQLQNGTAEQE